MLFELQQTHIYSIAVVLITLLKIDFAYEYSFTQDGLLSAISNQSTYRAIQSQF